MIIDEIRRWDQRFTEHDDNNDYTDYVPNRDDEYINLIPDEDTADLQKENDDEGENIANVHDEDTIIVDVKRSYFSIRR